MAKTVLGHLSEKQKRRVEEVMAARKNKSSVTVILCENGRYMELTVHEFEKNNIFGSNRTRYTIEGSLSDADILAADNTLEGAAINAGGIPPEIYLKCPDCSHIAEGHECSSVEAVEPVDGSW